MPSHSNPKTRSRQGCWTCKARKVPCDQAKPTCRRCSQAGRECEGYAMRLSWPRDNDKRRSMKVTVPTAGKRTRQRTSHGHFINATFQDIELFRYLTIPGVSKPPIAAAGQPSLKLWSQPRSGMTHTELVYYFRDAAHRSLATFGPTTTPMRDVILRMVLSQDTVSRRALFHALLAFSSLHRSGLHHTTMAFKVAALEALSASAKEAAQGPVEAAQHVAACMILCAFEILLPSENSGEWLWHIRGAMEIIQRAQLGTQSDSGSGACSDAVGTSSLIDWVYYHNSVSRFALSHWRHKALAAESTAQAQITPYPLLLAEARPPLPFQTPTHGILNVLSEVCAVLLDPSDPRSQEASYKERLRALEWKVDNIPSAPSSSFSSSSSSPSSASHNETYEDEDSQDYTINLYKAATRIYLARATQSIHNHNQHHPHQSPTASTTTANLADLTARAFAGPVRDCSFCRHFFPLLIIACEARPGNEGERDAILALVSRTEARGYVRSMAAFRAQVCAFWTLRDLCDDDDFVVDYVRLMRAVVSSNPALPSFV
ncbi:fungal-specific transcription factor domain-containing protein [Nemania sp. NC0429]|nr:fungal-specific transcription factor domain-containing protein [Nemania sp. NC0429]